MSNFNSHSHEGSDIDKLISCGAFSVFQSTLPRREWHILTQTLNKWKEFQSTLPRREWQDSLLKLDLSLKFQSTLPRREWPIFTALFFFCSKFQSTLPRREWLLIYDLAVCYCYISIHTPTKGVTALICTPSSTYKNFNPHSHEGSDENVPFSFQPKLNFNPHSHEGSDYTPLLITYWG